MLYNKDFIPCFNSFVSLLWIYICWSVRAYNVLEGSLKFNCLLDVFLKALNGLLIHMHSTHTHTHTHTHKRTNTNTNEFWKLISMISEETVRDDCINYCNVQLLKWFHLFCLFVTRASVAFRVIDWFCWHTTKLSLTKLVVFVIDWLIRRFIISFYNPCDSGLWKQPWLYKRSI